MKYIIFLIALLKLGAVKAQSPDTLTLKQNIKGSAKAKFICTWGAKKYMELASNERIYIFKSGLKDGIYIATYDKKIDKKRPIKDTAMVAVIEDGELNGLLRRWDDEDKTIAEECEYKDGLMNGWRKLYFYAPDGMRYVDIQKCVDSACIDVHTEW